jgi:hypothetical protein
VIATMNLTRSAAAVGMKCASTCSITLFHFCDCIDEVCSITALCGWSNRTVSSLSLATRSTFSTAHVMRLSAFLGR